MTVNTDIVVRFKLFFESLGFNQAEFAKKVNSTQGVTSRILSGRLEPSKDIIIECVKHFRLNSNWLLSDYGGMFLKEFEQDQRSIPLVTLIAAGKVVLEEIESEDRYVIPGLSEKNCIAGKVEGDSMRPIIERNDILILKKIPSDEIKNKPRVYVVVHDYGTSVKKIIPTSSGYRCVSYNSEEAEFKVKNFIGVYKIVRHIHPYRDYLFP